jgi:hypothetical protein
MNRQAIRSRFVQKIRSDVRNRLLLHSPVLTGVLFDDLDGADADVHKALSDATGLEWQKPSALRYGLTYDPPEKDVEGSEKNVVFQEYTPILRADLSVNLPWRVVSRPVLTPTSFSHPFPAFLQPLDSTGSRWVPSELAVDVWNCGVALISLTVDVHTDTNVSWRDYHALSDCVRKQLEQLCIPLISQAVLSLQAFASGAGYAYCTTSEDAHQSVAPLWRHAVFLVEQRGVATKRRDAIADELSFGGERCTVTTTTESRPANVSDALVAIGLDSCVVFGPSSYDVAVAFGRIIGLHTVAWAAAINWERHLSIQLRRRRADSSLRALEQESTGLNTTYERVQAFRTGLDNAPLHLAQPDASLWRCVDSCWGLRTQVEVLDRKLEALDRILDHLTTDLTSRRTRRLNDIAMWFTVVAIVTASIAVIGFTQQNYSWIGRAVNIAIAATLIAISVIARLFIARSAEQSLKHREPR